MDLGAGIEPPAASSGSGRADEPGWPGLLDLYREELRLLVGWQGGRSALARRLAKTLALSTLALGITSSLVPGIHLASPVAALGAIVAMALFDALVRPVVLAVVARVSVLYVGLASLVLHVGVLMIALPLVPGVRVDGFPPALLGTIVLAAVNAMLIAAFGIDRGGTFYGRLVRRWALHRARPIATPGVAIIQIDGLAQPILAGRIRAGYLPVLSRLIRSRSHVLDRWEPMLPSMTSASQAGILFGSNDGIPAFRWYERERRHLMVSSDPTDAAEIARRLSTGSGLLSGGGASIGNLLEGDAARSFVTASTYADPMRRLGDGRAYLWFFLNPSSYLRTTLQFVREIVAQRVEAMRVRRSAIEPRLPGDRRHAIRRAVSKVVLRDLNSALIIEEMYRGTPVIYADYTDYDEVAHHSGPERLEALRALDGIDEAIGVILDAAADAPRPYRFVFLSDHGQSLGSTFAQRYGQTLAGLIGDLTGEPVGDGRPTESGRVAIGSGNLGLVYLGSDRRLTLEEIGARHSGLVAGLAAHPGIGLILARSVVDGPVVIGAEGRRALASGDVTGSDPTAVYGPNAVASLLREDGMSNAPDLLLLSRVDPDLGEVSAFEELIGSHGGLGGFQTQAFILHPADWTLDEPVPLGAPAVHRNLRRWLGDAGIAFAPSRPSGTASPVASLRARAD